MMRQCSVVYRLDKFGFMNFLILVNILHLCSLKKKEFNVSVSIWLERYVERLAIEGLQIFGLGKSTRPYAVAAYVKGKKVILSPFE